MMNKNRNLILVFSTFLIKNRDELYNRSRQNDYAICYNQLLRIIPNYFDVVFVDNSVSHSNEITLQSLLSVLKDQKILLTQRNLGLKNKGVGELAMLIQASSVINFGDYENVVYCTGRKLFTCPYPFEKAVQTDQQATVANPDFQFLDGTFIKSAKGMYNDMLFSMKSQTMTNFVEYTRTRLDYLEQYMINSETNLFNFIQENNVTIQELPALGIVRNGLDIQESYFSFENYHIC